MTQEEYLQKQIELGDRLLAERQRHLEVMNAIETRSHRRLVIEINSAAEARISENITYSDAVSGIEAEIRKLKADWIAEQYASNATALQVELLNSPA